MILCPLPTMLTTFNARKQIEDYRKREEFIKGLQMLNPIKMKIRFNKMFINMSLKYYFTKRGHCWLLYRICDTLNTTGMAKNTIYLYKNNNLMVILIMAKM